LMELQFLLALGQHIDLVINVDGYCEFALAYANHRSGVHPVMPALQIAGALGMYLGHPTGNEAGYLQMAYDLSTARAGVARYERLLAESRSGLAFLKNTGAVWLYRQKFARASQVYDAAMHSDKLDILRDAEKLLSLDMPTVPDSEVFQELFDIWFRSS